MGASPWPSRIDEVELAAEKSIDETVLEHLQVVGVALLAEWDALAFVNRHSTTLCTAAQIARSIGYNKAETGDALEKLETLGLIARSRGVQGIRFYRFSAPPEPLRHACLQELLSLSQHRAGRLLLLGRLKRSR